MDLSDAVNAMYCQSLSAKRYLEKHSVQLQLSDEDASALIAKVEAVTAEIKHTVACVKSLTHGLRTLTIGELRQLCAQLNLPPMARQKEKLIQAILQYRMARPA